MSTLLKSIHNVYSIAVCSIATLAIGIYVLSPQLVIKQEISQSCFLPEVIDTTISLTITEENAEVNCRQQRVRITKNGSLVIKSEGVFAEKKPEILVSSLIVDEGGTLALENNSLVEGQVLAEITPVTIRFSGFTSIQDRKIFEYAELSHNGNLMAIDKPSVLGVNSNSGDNKDVTTIFPGIILANAGIGVEQPAFVSAEVSRQNEAPVDAIISQIFECEEQQICRNDGMFISGISTEFPFALSGQGQELKFGQLVEGQSVGASVLGVSGKVLPMGSFVERDGFVVLRVNVDPKYYVAKPQQIQVEFEVKPFLVPYDGKGDIFTSDSKYFDGQQTLSISTEIGKLAKNSAYKWRARIVNVTTNERSEWVSYGEAEQSLPAFVTSTAKKLEVSTQKHTVSTQEKVSITVKAINDKGEVDPDFRGVVKFSSDQQTADLPRTYSFTKEDRGQKTFESAIKFYEPGNAFVTVVDSNNYSLSSTLSFSVTQNERVFLSLSTNNLYPIKGDRVQVNWQANGLIAVRYDQQQVVNQKTGRINVISNTPERIIVEGLNQKGNVLIASVDLIPNQADSSNTKNSITGNSNVIQSVEGVSTAAFPPLPEDVYSGQNRLTVKNSEEIEIFESPAGNVCPTIESFNSSNSFVKEGMTTTLSWSVKNAEKVVIDTLPGDLPLKGAASLGINETETITLKAVNGKCHRSAQISIMTVSVFPWEGTGAWLAGIIALEIAAGASVVFAEQGTKYNLWAAILTFVAKLRNKKRLGVVYDTETGLPLAGATVEVYDMKGVKKIAQSVSDNHGCVYVDLLPVGTYSLRVDKFGFKLFEQSESKNGKSHFLNTMKGGYFKVTDKESGPLAIPLKKNKKFTERVVYHFSLLIEEVLTASGPLILIAGLLYSAAITLLYPVSMNWVFFGLYILFTVVKTGVYFAQPYRFGVVRTINGLPVSNVALGLYSRDSKELLAQSRTNEKGRYIFFAPRGTYHIKVLDEGYKLLAKDSLRNSIVVRLNNYEDDVFAVSKNLAVYPTSQRQLRGNLRLRHE